MEDKLSEEGYDESVLIELIVETESMDIVSSLKIFLLILVSKAPVLSPLCFFFFSR